MFERGSCMRFLDVLGLGVSPARGAPRALMDSSLSEPPLGSRMAVLAGCLFPRHGVEHCFREAS